MRQPTQKEIEVAKAIAESHGVDPEASGPGQRYVAEVDGITTILTGHHGPLWKLFMNDARAAIRAIEKHDSPRFDKGPHGFIYEVTGQKCGGPGRCKKCAEDENRRLLGERVAASPQENEE